VIAVLLAPAGIDADGEQIYVGARGVPGVPIGRRQGDAIEPDDFGLLAGT